MKKKLQVKQQQQQQQHHSLSKISSPTSPHRELNQRQQNK
jgi:hypothetical protein